jgi:excinuclease UvrABC nuclease subunit
MAYSFAKRKKIMSTQTYSLTFDGYWREPNISGLPTNSGIYCIYTCIYDQNEKTVSLKRLIYIGEAGNVKERVSGHDGWDAWRTYLRDGQVLCVSTSPAESGSRVRIEAACIKHHQPPSNTEYKEAFPYDTTTVTTSGKNAFLDSSFTVKTKQ